VNRPIPKIKLDTVLKVKKSKEILPTIDRVGATAHIALARMNPYERGRACIRAFKFGGPETLGPSLLWPKGSAGAPGPFGRRWLDWFGAILAGRQFIAETAQRMVFETVVAQTTGEALGFRP
jgi:hypothetical protein